MNPQRRQKLIAEFMVRGHTYTTQPVFIRWELTPSLGKDMTTLSVVHDPADPGFNELDLAPIHEKVKEMFRAGLLPKR